MANFCVSSPPATKNSTPILRFRAFLTDGNLVWYPRHRSNAQRTCSARPRAPLLPLLMVLFYTFYRYGPELGRVRFACVSCPRLRFSNEPDLQSVVSTVHVFMFVRFLCLSRVRPGSHRCLFTVCARVSRVCPGSLRCLFTGTCEVEGALCGVFAAPTCSCLTPLGRSSSSKTSPVANVPFSQCDLAPLAGHARCRVYL